MIALVKHLLADRDIYVQKGVGWTLRELGNVYPKETWNFLRENIQRISATAFSAATEKLPAKQKAVLKDARKGKKSQRKPATRMTQKSTGKSRR